MDNGRQPDPSTASNSSLAGAERLRSFLVNWESHSELIKRFETACELVSGRVPQELPGAALPSG